MKKMIYLLGIAILSIASSQPEVPADKQIKGAWKVVSSQYGKEPTVVRGENEISHKLFTGTRWSSASFDKNTNKITGTAGGTYTIKGSVYMETVEYYSWDADVVGKTFKFSMTIENGKLHQKGFMEWKGDPNYVIDEFYSRVD